jgi:hypothetical protein
VDNVQEDAQTEPVRLVNEVLQVFRRTATRRNGERVRDVISERAVVRVLHHRHELHGVVPTGGDARQDVVGKLAIRSHLAFVGAHADVRFVNA